jgi:hypothetical protein
MPKGLSKLKDRMADQYQRLGVVWLIVLQGMFLVPLLLDLGWLLAVRWGIIRLDTSAASFSGWLPVAIGMAACLLLPTETIAARVAIAGVYVIAMAALFAVFNVTVGCLIADLCL